MHSNIYKTPDIMKDKKVLIVGIGVSGNEILAAISPVAKSVEICTRRFDHDSESLGPLVKNFKVYPNLKEINDAGEIVFIDGSKTEVQAQPKLRLTLP